MIKPTFSAAIVPRLAVVSSHMLTLSPAQSPASVPPSIQGDLPNFLLVGSVNDASVVGSGGGGGGGRGGRNSAAQLSTERESS